MGERPLQQEGGEVLMPRFELLNPYGPQRTKKKLSQLLQSGAQIQSFDKEFPEFLTYFRIASGSTDPYHAIAVAQNLVDDPLLKEKAGELAKSLMMGVVNEMDTSGTPAGFANFIGLLTNHQRLGLSLIETIEKLTTLTEERYFIRIKEGIRSRPVTHTWIRLGTTAALLVYMYYPILVTLFRDLVFQ